MFLFKDKVENKLLVLENEVEYFQYANDRSFKYEVLPKFHTGLLRSICSGLNEKAYMIFCKSLSSKS